MTRWEKICRLEFWHMMYGNLMLAAVIPMFLGFLVGIGLLNDVWNNGLTSCFRFVHETFAMNACFGFALVTVLPCAIIALYVYTALKQFSCEYEVGLLFSEQE